MGFHQKLTSSIMGLCQPWAFVRHGPSSVRGFHHPASFISYWHSWVRILGLSLVFVKQRPALGSSLCQLELGIPPTRSKASKSFARRRSIYN
jgi:hypothetical protein